jgi:hypothetical protein
VWAPPDAQRGHWWPSLTESWRIQSITPAFALACRRRRQPAGPSRRARYRMDHLRSRPSVGAAAPTRTGPRASFVASAQRRASLSRRTRFSYQRPSFGRFVPGTFAFQSALRSPLLALRPAQSPGHRRHWSIPLGAASSPGLPSSKALVRPEVAAPGPTRESRDGVRFGFTMMVSPWSWTHRAVAVRGAESPRSSPASPHHRTVNCRCRRNHASGRRTPT